jgi:hypothetical protein
MCDAKIKKRGCSRGRVGKEGKNIRTQLRKNISGLHAGDTTWALNEGAEETNHPIMTYTTKVFKKRTGEEVTRIEGKRRIAITGAGRRKSIRGR